MSELSEDAIKHIALGFLKSYYRLRPRAEFQPTITGLDMRGKDDIVADGFLRYSLDGGTFFTATFEATSHETRDEILFRPRVFHAFWDALVVISIIVAVLFATAHINDFFLLVADTNEAFTERLIYLHLGIAGFSILMIAVFKKLPRYRNIHAIEQFKQYHADDQWVAYGYDVFDGLKERYKKELVSQCTRYGFGLVEISQRHKPQLIIAPSQAENFIPKESYFSLLSNSEWQNKLKKIASGPWEKIKKWAQTKFTPKQSKHFRWFPRTYYNQWALILLSISASFFFIRQEYKMLPFYYAHEKRYKTTIIEEHKGKRLETEYYLVDVPAAGFYDSIFAPYEMHLNEERFHGIIQTAILDTIGGIDAPIRILYSEADDEPALYYNCERFHGLDMAFYILTDTFFDNLAMARNRVSYLNNKGLTATAVWPPCLGGKGGGFLLYVDEIIIDSLEAVELRDSLQLQMDSLDQPLKILHFTPK